MEAMDGRMYRGQFNSGKPDGSGMLWLPDGSVTSGEFHGDFVPNGFALQAMNGAVYAGAMVGGAIKGEGLEWINRQVLWGTFDESGLKHGFQFQADTDLLHYGSFTLNVLNGPGLRLLPDGTTISGIFIGNNLNPRARITRPSGEVFYWCGKEKEKNLYRSSTGDRLSY